MVIRIARPPSLPPKFIPFPDPLPGIVRIALYLLCTISALVLLTIVRPHTDDGLIHQIGKNCALVGFMILVMQTILASRFKWIERPFGMDMVIRFHKAAAVVAITLLLLHPPLVALGSYHWQLLNGLDIRWPVWLGRIAMLALLINVGTSLWRSRLNIKFESWRSLHNLLGIVILSVGFVHSYRIGGDLSALPMRAFWILAFASTAAVYIFHRSLRPVLLRRHQFSVTRIRQETPRVWAVQLEPMGDREVAPYIPGQFRYVTLHRAQGLPVEEHHWTISSSPTRPGLEMTIKESGDFTSTIGLAKVGDRPEVLGPYGRPE